jgi:hypothetical protein
MLSSNKHGIESQCLLHSWDEIETSQKNIQKGSMGHETQNKYWTPNELSSL